MNYNSVLRTPSDEYWHYHQMRKEVRACIGGKMEVMKIVSCLPPPQYQMYNTYNLRDEALRQAIACNEINLERARQYWAGGRLFPATAVTYDSLHGMVWSQEPEVDIDPQLEYMLDNADGAGNGLREIAQFITGELIAHGRCGALVDMPTNEKPLTAAEMQMPEKAPRIITYDADQILWYRLENGRLMEVRLLECVQVQKGDFDWEDKEQVRRLVIIDGIYVNQLYDEADNLIEESIPVMNGSNMDCIPFVFFGADKNGAEQSRVPLYDLANINLGHFKLDCSNRENLHYHLAAMTNIYTDMDNAELAESNPNGISVAASGRNRFRQGDRVEILQIEANGAGPSEMERDEKRMVMACAQIVTESSKNQTLGAKEIETNASTSTLKRISLNATAGINKLLGWCSGFLGSQYESNYRINTDFITDKMTPEMIGKHIEMVQLGVLPKSTLYETARKVEMTNLDDDELKEAAEQDAAEIAGVSEEQAVAQAAIDAEEDTEEETE